MENEIGPTKRKSPFSGENNVSSHDTELHDLAEKDGIRIKRRSSARLQRLRAERDNAREDEGEGDEEQGDKDVESLNIQDKKETFFPDHLAKSSLLGQRGQKRTNGLNTTARSAQNRNHLLEFFKAGQEEQNRLLSSQIANVAVGSSAIIESNKLSNLPHNDVITANIIDGLFEEDKKGEQKCILNEMTHTLTASHQPTEEPTLSKEQVQDPHGYERSEILSKTPTSKATSNQCLEDSYREWHKLVRHYDSSDLESSSLLTSTLLRSTDRNWPRMAMHIERLLRVFDVIEDATFGLLARDKQVFVWLSDVQTFATDKAFRMSIHAEDIARIMTIFPESYRVETVRRTKLASAVSFDDIRLCPNVSLSGEYNNGSEPNLPSKPTPIVVNPFDEAVRPAPSLIEEGTSASRQQSNHALRAAFANTRTARYATIFFRCLLLMMRDHLAFLNNLVNKKEFGSSDVSMLLAPNVTESMMKARGVAIAKMLLPSAIQAERSLSSLLKREAESIKFPTASLQVKKLFCAGGLLQAENVDSVDLILPPSIVDWHFGYPVRTSLARLKPTPFETAVGSSTGSNASNSKQSLSELLSNMKKQIGAVQQGQVLPPPLPEPNQSAEQKEANALGFTYPQKIWIWRSKKTGQWESNPLSSRFKLLLAHVATCLAEDGKLALAPTYAWSDIEGCLQQIKKRTEAAQTENSGLSDLSRSSTKQNGENVQEAPSASAKSDGESSQEDEDFDSNDEGNTSDSENEYFESKFYSNLPQHLKLKAATRSQEKAREKAPQVLEAREQLMILSRLPDLMNRIRVTLLSHRSKSGLNTSARASSGQGGDVARMSLDSLVNSLAQSSSLQNGSQQSVHIAVIKKQVMDAIELLCAIATSEFVEIYQGVTIRVFQMKMNAKPAHILEMLSKLTELQNKLIPKLMRLANVNLIKDLKPVTDDKAVQGESDSNQGRKVSKMHQQRESELNDELKEAVEREIAGVLQRMKTDSDTLDSPFFVMKQEDAEKTNNLKIQTSPSKTAADGEGPGKIGIRLEPSPIPF